MLEIHHFRFGIPKNVPFSNNLVSSFWWENSKVGEITKDRLSFEKSLPLSKSFSSDSIVNLERSVFSDDLICEIT